MDKLVKHGIKMLEIIENERGFYKDMDGDVADIARAVYDVILRVQVLERKPDSSKEPNNCTNIDCFDTCKHAYSEVCDECYKGDKYNAVKTKREDEPQTDYGKSLQLFADILFDKEKSEQFLKECKAMGIEPRTERNSDEDR